MAVALINRLGQPGGFTYVTTQSSELVETMRALRWPSLAASLSCLIGCLGDPVGPAGTLVVRRLAQLDSVLVGAPGRPLSTSITFQVLDGAGRPVPAAAVSWTLAGTNARVDGAPANTNARGEVRAVMVLGTRASGAQ